MLEDAAGIRRVVLACGYVDLRKGIDGLSMIIGDKYRQNPFEKGTLFLFCGRRADRIKGLLWMGNGFLLLYKRFESGSLVAADNRRSRRPYGGTVPLPDAGTKSPRSEDQRGLTKKSRLRIVQNRENTSCPDAHRPTDPDLVFFPFFINMYTFG